MSKTYKIDEMDFVRAGTDFLGHSWSAHIAGEDFKKFVWVTFERKDGTTFPVFPIRKEMMDGKQTWFVVDEGGAMMMDF